jgi:thiamine biosynthesis lipoprotein
MGTEIHVLATRARARDAAEAVEALFEEWEHILSRFRAESELSRLNARAGAPVRVGRILMDAVEASLDAARSTGGLFDPTLRHELVRIGYDRPFEQVGDAHPAAAPARGGGGWRRIVVDRASGLVALPVGSGLDLGGIAKGMAVDASLALLGRIGIDVALVSAGGDLAVHGVPPDRRAWDVLVGDDPDGPVVPLARGALATSGLARRRWMQGDIPRHHLVDPRTGDPVTTGLREVTVAGPSCRLAEVGATAAFVAGPRLGPGLLERLGLAGLLIPVSGAPIRAGRWPRHDLPRAA